MDQQYNLGGDRMKSHNIKNILFGLSLSAIALMTSSVTFAASVNQDATATFNLVAPTETLKLTEASDITFKDATISAEDIVTTNSNDVNISIQELSGNAPGWQLSTKLSHFTGSTKGKQLTGAQLFYPSVTPTTTTSGDTSAILPNTLTTDNAFTGDDKGKVVSSGEDAVNIVIADVGKGYGSWTIQYPTDKIQLKIPAGNLQDTYTATLTYTLTDSPVSH